MTVGAGNFSKINAALIQAQIRVDTTYAKIQNVEALVAQMEIQLGIKECWAIGSTNYLQFKEEATLRKYRTVLNELEHLVVMRLFELLKLSLSGTGSTHLTCFSEVYDPFRLQTVPANWKGAAAPFRGNP